jgi:hypothetical protein
MIIKKICSDINAYRAPKDHEIRILIVVPVIYFQGTLTERKAQYS